MFCPKCGKKLVDGAKFCMGCGARIEIPAPPEDKKIIERTVPNNAGGHEVSGRQDNNIPVTEVVRSEVDRTSAPAGMPSIDRSGGNPEMGQVRDEYKEKNGQILGLIPFSEKRDDRKPEFVAPERNKKFKKIAGISTGAAALVIAAVAIVLYLLLGLGHRNNAFIYFSDGDYELIKDIKKGKDIEIGSSRSDNAFEYLMSFSPDGKYIYYFTKWDTSSLTGTLNRVEYAKLSEKTSRNDKYVETIGSNITYNYKILKNGSVVYKNGENVLYYYNGKDSERIAKDVRYFCVSPDEVNRIVYQVDNDDGYSLYGCEFKDIDNKVKLATNISYVIKFNDVDDILYVRYENDTSYLYKVGLSSESELLGELSDYISSGDEDWIISLYSGSELNLYDYVDDPYAESDAGIREPDTNDYLVPTYSYWTIDGDNLDESQFPELYTSCSNPLYWYGESGWWNYSMEEAVGMQWGDATDAIHAATQEFIDKYAASADDDGYIPVTEEVKADLKKISSAGTSNADWQWLWLCCTREESGTEVDYNAYDADYYKWEDARSRIYFREDLQNVSNNVKLKTLYAYENGKLTPISENVLTINRCGDGVIYGTADQVTDKISIDTVTDVYEVKELFDFDYEADNAIYLFNGTKCRMSADAKEIYGENHGSLYCCDKAAILSSGGLYAAAISDGVVGDFEMIADDGDVLFTKDDTIYYAAGGYNSNDTYYFDVYKYNSGKSAVIAKDVMYSSSDQFGMKLYDDGTVLAPTSYHSSDGSYELTMFDSKCNATTINDYVTTYIRVDPATLLYLSDGDFYLYDGKKSDKIRNDVDYIWSLNKMDYDHLYYYD